MLGLSQKLDWEYANERYYITEILSESPIQSIYIASDGQDARTQVLIKIFHKTFPRDEELSISQKLESYKSLPKKHGAFILDYAFLPNSLSIIIPHITGDLLRVKLSGHSLSLLETLQVGNNICELLLFYEDLGLYNGKVSPLQLVLNNELDVVLKKYNLTDKEAYLDRDELKSKLLLKDFSLPVEKKFLQSLKHFNLEDVLYMSPEQAGLLRYSVEITSDFYSLGIILYECISGSTPFHADHINDALAKIVNDTPRSLREQGFSIPRALDELISRLLLKDPRERYQTVRGIQFDLQSLYSQVQKNTVGSFVIGQQDIRSSLTIPAFIGRQYEIDSLQQTLQKSVIGTGGLVLLSAHSGCGKSMLLKELTIHQLNIPQACLVYGQGIAKAAQKPLQIFNSLIQKIIEHCNQSQEFCEHFRSNMGGNFEALLQVFPEFKNVYAIDVNSQGQEEHGETRSIEAISKMLSSISNEKKPIIIVLDDCQWADDMALSAIEHWSRNCHQAQDSIASEMAQRKNYVSMILSFRSDDISLDHRLYRMAYQNHVRLIPFSYQEITDFLHSMSGTLPDIVVHTIANASEGNPFFARAILEGFHESGVIYFKDKSWSFDQESLKNILSTKRAGDLLVERIELLDREVISLLKAAALIGKDFSLSRLKFLTAYTDDAISRACQIARSKHLIIVSDARSPQVEEKKYSFTHDKVREVLLSKLSEDEELYLHHLTGQSLMHDHETDPFEIAYHFAAAKEYTLAYPYALKSAKIARERFVLQLAIVNYNIARKGIGSSDSAMQFEISMQLGILHMLQGTYDDAYQEFLLAEKHVKNRFERASIDAKIGELEFKRGRVGEASEALMKGLIALGHFIPASLPVFFAFLIKEIVIQTLHSLFPIVFLRKNPSEQKKHEDLLASWLYGRLAYTFFFQRGTIPTLWTHLRQLNIAERYPPSMELGQACSTHAPVMSMVPWFKRAIRYGKKSLSIRLLLKDRWGEGQALHFLGAAYYASSQFEQAKTHFSNAISLLEKTGDLWEVNGACYHLAMTYYRMGDLKSARQLGYRIYKNGIAVGDRFASGAALNVISKASFGQIDAKMIADEIAKPSEDQQRNAEVLQSEGIRLLREKKYQQAVQTFAAAYAVVTKAGLRTEYIASIPCWQATALRLRFEQVSVYDLETKREILKSLDAVLWHAWFFALAFKNNIAHYYREYAYSQLMKGHNSKARELMEKSLFLAKNMGLQAEEVFSKLAISEMETLQNNNNSMTLNHLRDELEKLTDKTDYDDKSRVEPSLSLLDRFDTLLNIGRRITTALTVEDICLYLDESIPSLLRTRDFIVLQYHQDTRILEKKSGDLNLPYDEEIVYKTLQNKHSLIFPLIQGDVKQSILCSPIVVSGQTQFCFYVVYKKSETFFGEDELRLADYISALVGAAFENAQGFEKISSLSKSLERDIEEKQAIELSLQKSLAEKELILREVFHRTKNNMQIISSLLSLQMGADQDDKFKMIIQEAQNRIESMSLIHEKLYQSQDLVNINFSEYIRDVTQALKKSYVSHFDNISFDFDTDQTTISLEYAVPCGLIINEILTNSIKYAFPDDRTGKIKIFLRSSKNTKDETQVVFSISDNGVGLRKDYESYKANSLGLKLIKGLVSTQLQGQLRIENENGATFQVEFCELKYNRRL